MPEDIIKGFEILESKDISLGTTFDGGYYLIGMKKLYKEVFDESIKWGKKSGFEGTMHKSIYFHLFKSRLIYTITLNL